MYVLALLLALLQTPNGPRTENIEIQKTNPAGSSQNQKANKASVGAQHTPPVGDSSADKTEHDAGPFDKNLHRAEEFATILGVVAALIGLYFVWQQSSVTEGAAKSAKDSADAAKRSAEALFDIERPWLLVNEKDFSTLPFDQGSGSTLTSLMQWTFKNFGKTPARILRVRGRLITIDKIEELPAEPEYRDAPRYTDYTILAPQAESRTVQIPYDSVNVEQPTWKQVRSGEKLLLGMGSVIYKSPFGREHETRFCYLYDYNLSRFRDLIGPESYNRHT